MPCYVFNYHAFGSWMPDHRRGYVHRGEGIRPPDERMARLYRAKLNQAEVCFSTSIQRLLLDAALEACKCQDVRCHFIATDRTHTHVLVSWKSVRNWRIVRRQIRGNMTRILNASVERQQWFSKSASRKRVRDLEHFDYLVTRYLPKHRGWKWSEAGGLLR